MLGEKLKVDAGLGVKALGICLGDHIAKIFIPHFVFAEQKQVIACAVGLVALIEAGACRHIYLASDDGLYTLIFACAVKVDDTVHGAVVRNGNGTLAELFCASGNIRDTACAVKQTVFAMQMEMDERHVFRFLSIFG
jgi:hypothetical protein